MIDDSTRLRKLHMPGSITVLGVFVALSLTAVGVARHPESVQGTGKMLLQIGIALLLAYGLVGVWAWRPPFVMSGVALAGLALCVAHPTWSSWHRAGGMTSDTAISSSARTLRN